MKNLVPLLLLLGGCATPLDELYQQRGDCLQKGQICPELQDEIFRREMAQDRRQYQHARRCPPKMIEYCNQNMRGCGRRYKSESDEFSCITQQDMSDALRY